MRFIWFTHVCTLFSNKIKMKLLSYKCHCIKNRSETEDKRHRKYNWEDGVLETKKTLFPARIEKPDSF